MTNPIRYCGACGRPRPADVVFASPNLALKFSYDRILEVHVASQPSSTDWISLQLVLDHVKRRPLFRSDAETTDWGDWPLDWIKSTKRSFEAVSGVEGQRTRSATNEAWRESQESLRGAKNRRVGYAYSTGRPYPQMYPQEGAVLMSDGAEKSRYPRLRRWTSMDVYEPLWMAPRAGFQIGRKFLN
jgi:hypothetical protein